MKIVSAFAPPPPEYLALRFSKWGTAEARKFYWTMEQKTAHVIAAAEHALTADLSLLSRWKSGYVAWQTIIHNGIICA